MNFQKNLFFRDYLFFFKFLCFSAEITIKSWVGKPFLLRTASMYPRAWLGLSPFIPNSSISSKVEGVQYGSWQLYLFFQQKKTRMFTSSMICQWLKCSWALARPEVLFLSCSQKEKDSTTGSRATTSNRPVASLMSSERTCQSFILWNIVIFTFFFSRTYF